MRCFCPLDGGRQLLEAPLDPIYNNPDENEFNTYRQGLMALIRGLVQFERWDEIQRMEAIAVLD